jgi:hypothetical protein
MFTSENCTFEIRKSQGPGVLGFKSNWESGSLTPEANTGLIQ